MAGNPSWKKGGKSPNPHGRAALPDEMKKILRAEGVEAFKRLVAFSKNAKTEEIRYKATVEIVNRAYGKPVQPVGNESENLPFLIKTIN
jgi:hypothetical protein